MGKNVTTAEGFPRVTFKWKKSAILAETSDSRVQLVELEPTFPDRERAGTGVGFCVCLRVFPEIIGLPELIWSVSIALTLTRIAFNLKLIAYNTDRFIQVFSLNCHYLN